MISIEKAIEILGAKYKHCSDNEIEEIKDGAYMFADIFIEGILEKKESSQDENENYEQASNKKQPNKIRHKESM